MRAHTFSSCHRYGYFPPWRRSCTVVGAGGALVAVLSNHPEIIRGHTNRESPNSAARPRAAPSAPQPQGPSRTSRERSRRRSPPVWLAGMRVLGARRAVGPFRAWSGARETDRPRSAGALLRLVAFQCFFTSLSRDGFMGSPFVFTDRLITL
jgi:hypothetical protein